MTAYEHHYYDGGWQASSGTESIAIISSATEEAVAQVDNRMTIAQEEIFGPVLCVIACDTEADAVRIANDPLAPFGGYRKSGIGREIGPLALDEFFVMKSIQR